MPSPEQIEKAIAKVKPSHATFFVMEKDLSSKQLRNVRVFFPELYTYTKVVALLDTTLMKSGKEGFLLTQGSLHIHKLRDQVVSLLSIQKATASGSDVTITYSNGTTAQFYASIYAEDICAFLNALGPVERHKEEPKAAVPQKEAPRSAPQPEPAAAPQPNPVVKAEPKPEPKPQSKPVVKAEPKPEPKPQSKPTVPGQTEFEKGVEAMKQGREQEAVRLFEVAANAGHGAAMYELHIFYYNNSHPSMMDWLRNSAKAGHVPAYRRLAEVYISMFTHEPSNEDYTYAKVFLADRALYWLKKAIEAGDISAKEPYNLGFASFRKILLDAQVGDVILFGAYPSDEYGHLASIVWRVLEKKSDRMLVVSDKVLDERKFSDGKTNWAESSLRKWLNEEFINTAFDETDTSIILRTPILSNVNSDYDLMERELPAFAERMPRSKIKSYSSFDNIFILSWDEIIKYFHRGKPPKLEHVVFAKNLKLIKELTYWYDFGTQETAGIPTEFLGKKFNQRLFDNSFQQYGKCDYWLRDISAGDYGLYVSGGLASSIDLSLAVYDSIAKKSNIDHKFEKPKPGSIMISEQNTYRGVRPAMWIDLR